jgi:hypothetical protein
MLNGYILPDGLCYRCSYMEHDALVDALLAERGIDGHSSPAKGAGQSGGARR